jgi:hypothetical protein
MSSPKLDPFKATLTVLPKADPEYRVDRKPELLTRVETMDTPSVGESPGPTLSMSAPAPTQQRTLRASALGSLC